MEQTILQKIEISWDYPVYFTSRVFDPENPHFWEAVSRREPDKRHRLLFAIDDNMARAHPYLENQIRAYTERFPLLDCPVAPVLIPGGEAAKNDPRLVIALQEKMHALALCRHSFVVAIGGGAVLDMVGFACGTAHRGLRLIRLPTTVLSQSDSGVGVKNAVNAFGKKNFLGTFAVPFAVLNDGNFLTTLSPREFIAGVAEAVKVALLKDAQFFAYLEENAASLVACDLAIGQKTIYRCAELHLEHIRTSGDPFESGHSRPLDFGHWAAHKLESLSDYRLRHGEAVACGIALDTYYSFARGFLREEDCERVVRLLKRLGFSLYQPEMEKTSFIEGLSEFQEHLGGTLCITLLSGIGSPLEVHEMNTATIRAGIGYLRRSCEKISVTNFA